MYIYIFNNHNVDMVRWTCSVTLSVRRFEAMSLPAAPRGRCLMRFIHMGPMWCHVTSCHIHVLGSMISIHGQIPHRAKQGRICNVRCILCFISVRSQFYCNPKRSSSHWICGGTNHATCQVNFCPISDSLWPKQKHLTVGGVSCVSVPVSQFFRLDPREKPGVDNHDTMDPYDAPVCGDNDCILDLPGAEEVASSGTATARDPAGSFGRLDFHSMGIPTTW